MAVHVHQYPEIGSIEGVDVASSKDEVEVKYLAICMCFLEKPPGADMLSVNCSAKLMLGFKVNLNHKVCRSRACNHQIRAP